MSKNKKTETTYECAKCGYRRNAVIDGSRCMNCGHKQFKIRVDTKLQSII